MWVVRVALLALATGGSVATAFQSPRMPLRQSHALGKPRWYAPRRAAPPLRSSRNTEGGERGDGDGGGARRRRPVVATTTTTIAADAVIAVASVNAGAAAVVSLCAAVWLVDAAVHETAARYSNLFTPLSVRGVQERGFASTPREPGESSRAPDGSRPSRAPPLWSHPPASFYLERDRPTL